MKKLLLPFLFFASLSHAVSTVAVLEIVPSGDMSLKLSEYRHLTDELRTIARNMLSSQNYAILTRDNILSLMPTDTEEAECLAESCAIDIGRAIGAEYVTQGFVGEFGGMLTLTVELYESMSGHLLGSFVTESGDVMGLLKTIRSKAPDLFARIPKAAPVKKLDVAVDAVLDGKQKVQSKKIDPQVGGDEKKTSTSFWVALALDVVGAGLLVYGYTQEKHGADMYDDYVSLNPNSSPSQFDGAWQKVDDARIARNVSFVAGGVFLAAGIGVLLWF